AGAKSNKVMDAFPLRCLPACVQWNARTAALSPLPDSDHIGSMAKRPDKPRGQQYRDPAKHSKKDPAKPTRAKAARPDAAPLDPSLADLLNPAIGRGRAGVGSQTGLDEKKRKLAARAASSVPSPLA